MQRGGSLRFLGPSAAEAAARLPNETAATFHRKKFPMKSPKDLEIGKAEGTGNEGGPPEDDDDVDDAKSVPSLASVARLANDTAKRFLNSIASPKEDFGVDVRELLTPVGTQIDRATATVKLESMSHASIVVIVAIVYFAALISLLLAIILIALQSRSDLSLDSALGSFALEGIMRTISVLLTFVMLVFFSFRVVRYTMRTGEPVLPEQSLLILFLFLVMVTPGFSLFSPYLYWQQYALALDQTLSRGNGTQAVSAGNAFAIYFFSTSDDSGTARILTAIFTVIILAFGMMYFGLTVFFFGKPQDRSKKLRRLTGKDPEKEGTRAGDDGRSPLSDDEEDDNHSRVSGMTLGQALVNCCAMYKTLFLDANKPLLIVSTIYLIVTLTLVLVYDFLPSQVPFIGMISVLKICTQTESNQTVLNCDPSLQNGVPFARAMTITAQFIMEFIIAIYLHRITSQTKINLKTMSYEKNRYKHLGFRYFNSNKRLTFFMILLVSIITTSVSRDVFDKYDVSYNSETRKFTALFSPLNQVGINFFKLGFGPFYLLLTCFLFALAVAYLPPDSAPGIRGFCCGGYTVVTERDADHPAYILRETDVLLLRRYRDQAKERMQKEWRRKRRLLQFKAAGGATSSKRLGTINEEPRNAALESGGGGGAHAIKDEEKGNTAEMKRELPLGEDDAAGRVDEDDDEEKQSTPLPRAAGGNFGLEKPSVAAGELLGEDPGLHQPRKPTGSTTSETQALAAEGANKAGPRHLGLFAQPKLSYVERVKQRREDGVESVDGDERNLHRGTPDTTSPFVFKTPGRKLQEFFGQMQIPTTDRFVQHYEKLASLLRPKMHLTHDESLRLLSGSDPLSVIAEQMNANLFCMETEVLLLNFSFMAYNYGSFKDPVPLTNDEKQALLGKGSRYKLISHLENALTDIQCCVFVDTKTDRLYVAFRGTSTSKNVWQDIDYLQVPHEAAKGIAPLVTKPDDLIAKAASMQEPRVHRGFFYAYQSIREAVLAVVCDLIDSREQGCVLFCCGHSLGGALATHFALDIGMRYKVMESNLKGLQVSTFGSPRVGNYSYVCRHQRIVPTTHRFCIGGDPVPKLPPAQMFGEYTKWGYQHVGVEILLDVERVNLLLGPMFIERQIQHGWGGYVPKNHITGSYVLALALWCARVHPGFIPDWWLPVVNHVLKTERVRMRKILDMKKELNAPMVDQLNKEGAIVWTDDNRSLQNRGCDTSVATEKVKGGDQHQAERDDKVAASSSVRIAGDAVTDETGVEHIAEALAQCGILHQRERRAQVLFEGGFTSPALLQHVHEQDFERLNVLANVLNQTEGVSSVSSSEAQLFDEAFVKLLMRSLSINRCKVCDYAPLICPRCTEHDNLALSG